MRLRALLAGLVLLLAVSAILTTDAGRGAAPPAAIVSPPAVLPSAPSKPPAMPGRNVFEYADDETPVPQTFEPVRPPSEGQRSPDISPVSPMVAVRLIGFVRRASGLKAALALRGDVFVLAVGERAEGYVLLSADEDAGVRLEGPSGEVLTLPPS
jgi:hypothetical protein